MAGKALLGCNALYCYAMYLSKRQHMERLLITFLQRVPSSKHVTTGHRYGARYSNHQSGCAPCMQETTDL